MHAAYIRALSENGEEGGVFELLEKRKALFKEEKLDRFALEGLAWGVLHRAKNSSQLFVKLNALIGAALTRDVRALPFLLQALRGSNILLRLVAVKLSASYGDDPLQEELKRLLKEEKAWIVRQEVIRTIGILRMVDVREDLKQMIGHAQTTAEEKVAAILALVQMYDGIRVEEIRELLGSPRAGIRQLGCQLLAHFDLKEHAELLLKLLQDSSPEVRVEALYTLGLLGQKVTYEEIHGCLKESSPQVSIVAGWLAVIHGFSEGEKVLVRWLYDSHADIRRWAA